MNSKNWKILNKLEQSHETLVMRGRCSTMQITKSSLRYLSLLVKAVITLVRCIQVSSQAVARLLSFILRPSLNYLALSLTIKLSRVRFLWETNSLRKRLVEKFAGSYSLVKRALAFRVVNMISISEVTWLALMLLLIWLIQQNSWVL